MRDEVTFYAFYRQQGRNRAVGRPSNDLRDPKTFHRTKVGSLQPISVRDVPLFHSPFQWLDRVCP